MDSTNLMEKLSLMERAIINNNFRKKALAYRNVQDDGRIEQKRVNAIIEANLETEENDDGQNEFEDKGILESHHQTFKKKRTLVPDSHSSDFFGFTNASSLVDVELLIYLGTNKTRIYLPYLTVTPSHLLMLPRV